MQKKSNAKKFVVLIIIAAIILVAGFYAYKNLYKPFFSAQNDVAKKLEKELEECQKMDYGRMAALSDIANPNYSEVLYISLMSFLEKDEKFCELIIGEEQKNQCLDLFYGYSYVAFGDDNYLNRIKNGALKSFGLAVKNGNSELCPSAEGRAIQTCKAAAAGDIEICRDTNKNNDKELSEECESNVYLAAALREKDLSACDKINRNGHLTSEVQHLVCLAVLDKKETAAGEFIDSYRNKFCPHKYAFTIAKEKNDSSLCGLIPWQETYNKANYGECIMLPQN